ncbi:unnamed protein product, partial [marine sediment metagenome]
KNGIIGHVKTIYKLIGAHGKSSSIRTVISC